MKTVAFHSYKGGTGKSYLSSNLAAIFAERGKVCILDMDLMAPTLQSLFDVPAGDVWLNDVLDGEADIFDVLYKVEDRDLFLGMANSQPEAIRATLGKSKEREMSTLRNMLSLKEKLANEGFDWLMLDTSPGYEYASINSIATADVVGIVTTLYRPDVVGSRAMVKGLYDVLEKPAFMIVNRYHNIAKYDEFCSSINEVFKGRVHGMKCFCDDAEEIGSKVITLHEPEHVLSGSIRELAKEITAHDG